MEHLFLMFLDHTQRRTTVGRTPLDEWSARRRDLYLTTQDTHRQITMPPVGFEPKISAGERPQTAHLLRSWVRIPPGAWIFVWVSCLIRAPTVVGASRLRVKETVSWLTVKLFSSCTKIHSYKPTQTHIHIMCGASGGAVGWGTALQAGRSHVRFPMLLLEFFIDIILPAALWPWGWLSL